MCITEFFVCILLFGITFLIFFQVRPKGKNYPPGPWGNLPLVGHLFFMGKYPYKTFTAWKKKYGPVFSVTFGSFDAVVINDYKLIGEALSDNSFSGRPLLRPIVDRCGGEMKGVVFTEGQEWTEQRRFILRHLKEFGFGKKSMEGIIQDEITELIEHLRKDLDSPISTHIRFNAAVLNALWTIVAGERFKQDDPELHSIVKQLSTNIQEHNFISGLATFMPWIADVAPKLSGYEKLVADTMPIMGFMKTHVEHHKKTFETGHIRDFLDVYLDEVKNTSDPDSSFYREKGMKSSIFTLADLFVGGSETTSTTLSWAFLYLAKFPEAQKKVHKEIDKIVGNSRLPSLSDRPTMIYTEATIHEILRFSSLAPLSIFHKTTKEVQLGGYTIPADTMIVPNFYDAHFDKAAWGDPENFRPERFISANGTLQRNEAFMPFGTGKRSCIGETLARDELFLFVASLFQRFSVSPCPNEPELSLDPIVSTILSPKSHKLVLIDRF